MPTPEVNITASHATVAQWIENAYREGWHDCRETMGHSIEDDWRDSTAKVMAASPLPYLHRPTDQRAAAATHHAGNAPLTPEGIDAEVVEAACKAWDFTWVHLKSFIQDELRVRMRRALAAAAQAQARTPRGAGAPLAPEGTR